MKRMLGIFLAFTVAASSWAVASEPSIPLSPKLVLVKLVPVQIGEKQGDELYFDMSIAKTNEATRFVRLPEAPMHWPSRLASQLKNVTLWTAAIARDQQVSILLSLNEQDAAPINLDDFIGSLQVTLKNVNGVIKVDWQVPGSEAKPANVAIKGEKVMKFTFTGTNGSYEAYFSVI